MVDPAQATLCGIHRLPPNRSHARGIPLPTLSAYGTRIVWVFRFFRHWVPTGLGSFSVFF